MARKTLRSMSVGRECGCGRMAHLGLSVVHGGEHLAPSCRRSIQCSDKDMEYVLLDDVNTVDDDFLDTEVLPRPWDLRIHGVGVSKLGSSDAVDSGDSGYSQGSQMQTGAVWAGKRQGRKDHRSRLVCALRSAECKEMRLRGQSA